MKTKAILAALFMMFTTATLATAFGEAGCGAGECADCHSLSREQAADVLKPLGAQLNIEDVSMSQVPGMWTVVLLRPDGMKIPVFLDFSLQYIIQGEALKINTKENVTRYHVAELNKVDVSTIETDDALLMGDADAKYKIIVFSDPECPYCKKGHETMKEVVASRDDIAFYIKMLPLDIHPTAYEKAKAIVCEKSMKMLEDSLDGKEIPAATCDTNAIEQTKQTAARIRIASTPSFVFPDGRVIAGYKTAEDIVEMLGRDDTYETADK